MSHRKRDDERGEPSQEVPPPVPTEWSGEEGRYHIMARGMNISWGEDDRFWKWPRLSEAELREIFSIDAKNWICECAELNQVSWLEATKTLDLDDEKYKKVFDGYDTCDILYNIKFKVDAFGWHGVPVTFQVNNTLTPAEGYTKDEKLESYRKRTSGWQQIHGGDFKIPKTEKKGEVKFGMYEIKSQRWKGGILLAGVTLKLHKSATTD
nr:PREDICTED: protein PHLOEM PROTEIN 2-LIKE A1-like isoform X1 [Musa acuminata subsp. malaccensis]